ncbi:hypothetical protein RHECNPAF_2530082 [Rhizobium etli CNPAF512]|nr:hypothetical protein RHECNPAF_2530082 [Rhizobium etli CNPAF512]
MFLLNLALIPQNFRCVFYATALDRAGTTTFETCAGFASGEHAKRRPRYARTAFCRRRKILQAALPEPVYWPCGRYCTR